MSITCSICIANYNGMRTIDACLESVFGQVCNLKYEIIVHDDASTDGSADYIAAKFPTARLLRSEHNVGYCISNNRMVERALGHYILLLNNDAVLFPDALSALLEAAEADSRPAILGLAQYDAATGELLDRGCRLDPFLNPIPCADIEGRELAMVMGACLWIPRSLWREIGGFPEWIYMLAEDMYVCLAARIRGFDIKVPSTSGFRHWVGASLGGGKVQDGRLRSTLKRRSLSERNKTFVMVVLYPTAALALVLPLHILLLLTEGTVMALIRWDREIFTRIYVSALRETWSHRSILIAQRQREQRCRNIGLRKFFMAFSLLPHKLRLLFRHGLPRIVH